MNEKAQLASTVAMSGRCAFLDHIGLTLRHYEVQNQSGDSQCVAEPGFLVSFDVSLLKFP